MVARHTGSFIDMSSISAHRAGFNVFGYEVAKAALVHLTRCAAIELGEKGVRVNSISPGPTRTGIFAKAGGVDHDAADERMEAVEAAFADLLPSIQAMPGMIHAEDIANAAVFLASDEARFVNGRWLAERGRPSVTDGSRSSRTPATHAGDARYRSRRLTLDLGRRAVPSVQASCRGGSWATRRPCGSAPPSKLQIRASAGAARNLTPPNSTAARNRDSAHPPGRRGGPA